MLKSLLPLPRRLLLLLLHVVSFSGLWPVLGCALFHNWISVRFTNYVVIAESVNCTCWLSFYFVCFRLSTINATQKIELENLKLSGYGQNFSSKKCCFVNESFSMDHLIMERSLMNKSFITVAITNTFSWLKEERFKHDCFIIFNWYGPRTYFPLLGFRPEEFIC